MPSTRSAVRLGARRERAFDLFKRGWTNVEVAREVDISPGTASRYRKIYDNQIKDAANANPEMLRDVLGNTLRSLGELDAIRKDAAERYLAATTDAARAQFLKIRLSAQEQRSRLFGLLGVKGEFVLHVQTVKARQDKLLEFMSEHLCPADRDKLEEFIIREFQDELAELPEVTEGAS